MKWNLTHWNELRIDYFAYLKKKKLEKKACASKEQFGSAIYDEIFKKYENIMVREFLSVRYSNKIFLEFLLAHQIYVLFHRE